MGLCITLGQEIVYIRDFMDGGAYYRMNTVFKFSMPAWLCFGVGGALAVQHMWRIAGRLCAAGLVGHAGVAGVWVVRSFWSKERRHVSAITSYGRKSALPVSANYTPTLDGFAFARPGIPATPAAITWLNDHVDGSPVILEGVAPQSYQWYNRVSVYTGLPDVVGLARS